jgi:hypothetical protein
MPLCCGTTNRTECTNRSAHVLVCRMPSGRSNCANATNAPNCWHLSQVQPTTAAYPGHEALQMTQLQAHTRPTDPSRNEPWLKALTTHLQWYSCRYSSCRHSIASLPLRCIQSCSLAKNNKSNAAVPGCFMQRPWQLPWVPCCMPC